YRVPYTYATTTGQEATHAGSEEQVTGEDRRDAGEDGEEGRPGIFRRIGLIPLRRPGEREVRGRGPARHHRRRGAGAGRDGGGDRKGQSARHHPDCRRREGGICQPLAIEGDPGELQLRGLSRVDLDDPPAHCREDRRPGAPAWVPR